MANHFISWIGFQAWNISSRVGTLSIFHRTLPGKLRLDWIYVLLLFCLSAVQIHSFWEKPTTSTIRESSTDAFLLGLVSRFRSQKLSAERRRRLLLVASSIRVIDELRSKQSDKKFASHLSLSVSFETWKPPEKNQPRFSSPILQLWEACLMCAQWWVTNWIFKHYKALFLGPCQCLESLSEELKQIEIGCQMQH